MSAKGSSRSAAYRDPLILLACVIFGGALGMILGEKASIIKPIGQIFINVLFCLVVPLVFFSIYTFLAAGKPGVRAYFKNILTPVLTALGTRSSAAAIPGQLEACDRIGVPREVSSVVVPMGATCHMDGSCMSSIFKISVMCYVFNRPLTGFTDLAFAFFVAVCSSVAMSSVPGGGAISETMIISLFGFPVEGLPICIMLSQLCDAATTLVNSSGDTAASMLVTRILYGKGWMEKDLSEKQRERA